MVYEQGYESRGPASRNPYVNDPELYEWWRRGWKAKFHGEIKEEFE